MFPSSVDIVPELFFSSHNLAILSQAPLNGASYGGENIGDPGRIDGIFNRSATSRYWIRAGALPLPSAWQTAPIGQVDHSGSLELIDPVQQVIVISLVWFAGELVGQRREALLEAVQAAIERI